MKKKVYLFELDSVRGTDEEIICGQQALYDEIVVNGNVVVMTLNQFIDSRGFFSLLQNDAYRDNIRTLFEKGAIRISQFKNTKTICQYLLDSLDSDREFIYSVLPIKSTQKHLLALIKRALIYCNLQELYEYDDEDHLARTYEDFKELFAEYDRNGNRTETSMSFDEMKLIMHNLYHLIEIILKISPLNQIYTYSKKDSDYQKYNLSFYLDKAMHLNLENSFSIDMQACWKDAISILNSLKEKNIFSSNERSKIVRELKREYVTTPNYSKKAYQLAEAIVDLSYNYACEMSIRNISKHYNVEDLENANEINSFQEDFANRLSQLFINKNDLDSCFLKDETNQFIQFNDMSKIPDFSGAIHYLEYENYFFDATEEENGKDTLRYEYDYLEQQKEQRSLLRKGIINKILWMIFYFVIAIIFESAINSIQDRLNTHLSSLGILFSFISKPLSLILSVMLSEYLGLWIKKRYENVLTLSDAIFSFVRIFHDIKFLRKLESHSYHTDLNSSYYAKEKFNYMRPTEKSYSSKMKKYMRLKNANEYASLFLEPNTVYPFADLTNNDIKNELCNYEEVHDMSFGLIYKSKFNMLVVDPVINKTTGKIFPYERLVSPIGKSGVVILAEYHGKFIFLKQFRHALRKEMLALPRGYAEEDSKTPMEDAVREIIEEINGQIIGQPIELGRIASDSGSTNNQAHVFYMQLENYEKNTESNEGIKSILELSEEEVIHSIYNNEITDGFTLGAFTLYRIRQEHH